MLLTNPKLSTLPLPLMGLWFSLATDPPQAPQAYLEHWENVPPGYKAAREGGEFVQFLIPWRSSNGHIVEIESVTGVSSQNMKPRQ